MNNFIAFLSEDAIGRPSPLRAVFGGLDKAKFTQRMNNFVQHVCRMFYKDEFNVFVANNEKVIKARGEAKKKSQTSPMTAAPEAVESIKATIEKNGTTRVGDKSEPTPHGYYYTFIKDEKPYAVQDMNNLNLGILCKFKGKTEAEQYINDREREAAAVAAV